MQYERIQNSATKCEKCEKAIENDHQLIVVTKSGYICRVFYILLGFAYF